MIVLLVCFKRLEDNRRKTFEKIVTTFIHKHIATATQRIIGNQRERKKGKKRKHFVFFYIVFVPMYRRIYSSWFFRGGRMREKSINTRR